MKHLKRITVVLVALVALAGCGGNKADVAACKTAMKEQYTTATADPSAPESAKPAACKGVDDATLQRLAGEIIDEALDGK
jgi:hypothetical protein